MKIKTNKFEFLKECIALLATPLSQTSTILVQVVLDLPCCSVPTLRCKLIFAVSEHTYRLHVTNIL